MSTPALDRAAARLYPLLPDQPHTRQDFARLAVSADLLRRAAAKIRETAQAASEGPWSKRQDGDGTVSVVTPDVRFLAEFGSAVFPTVHRDAEHVALWSPDVAELVADLLDIFADLAEREGYPAEPESPALRLARRILGEES